MSGEQKEVNDDTFSCEIENAVMAREEEWGQERVDLCVGSERGLNVLPHWRASIANLALRAEWYSG